MDTDLAWEIHDKLMDEYFAMRKIINSDEQLKAKLLLSIYNGGQDGVLASKKLTEIEVKAATAPLLENIFQKEEVIKHQDNKLQTQKPFVQFALNVQQKCIYLTFEKAAKIVSDNYINIGRNTLMSELRKQGVLMDNNSPYEKYKKAGLFVCTLKEVYNDGDKVIPVTLVTSKGLIFIKKKLREWHGIKDSDIDVDIKEFCEKVKEM